MYGKGREPGPLAPVLLTGVEGDCERGLREGVEGSTRANAESAATVSSMQATNDNNRERYMYSTYVQYSYSYSYRTVPTVPSDVLVHQYHSHSLHRVGKVGFLALVSTVLTDRAAAIEPRRKRALKTTKSRITSYSRPQRSVKEASSAPRVASSVILPAAA